MGSGLSGRRGSLPSTEGTLGGIWWHKWKDFCIFLEDGGGFFFCEVFFLACATKTLHCPLLLMQN